MLNLRNIFFLVFIFLFISSLKIFSQTIKVDSLKDVLNYADNSCKASVYSELADSYIYISPQISEKYINKALIEAYKNNNKQLLSEIYRIFGIVKYYQNQTDSSLFYYYKSIKEAEKNGNEIEVAAANVNIGALLVERREYYKALESFFTAEKIFKENKIKENEAVTLNNIGLIYQRLNKPDSALIYFDNSLKKKAELNDYQGQAITLINMAIIEYKYKRNYKSAEEKFEASLHLLEETNDLYAISQLRFELGNYYFFKQNYSKAKKKYSQSNNSAVIINSFNIQKQNLKMLYEIAVIESNTDAALDYYKRYIVCKDTVENEKIIKNINNLKLKYETEKKEQKINFLQNEQKLKDKQIVLQKKVIFIFIIFLIITILFLIIVFFQKTAQSRANKDLTRKNLEIMQSESELIEAKTELETIIENMNLSENETRQLLKQPTLNIEQEKQQKLLILIKNAFDNDEIFLNKDLTIIEFAKMINSNKTYISYIINNTFDMNFSNFVNKYRVKKARVLLAKPENKNFTIEAIAGKAGFKSVTVFNKAFKKNTGLTPSKFIKNIPYKTEN